MFFLIVSTDIADPRATTPSLRLVNKASLDRVLQAEIYVNESDGQLRAHISSSTTTPFRVHSKLLRA